MSHRQRYGSNNLSVALAVIVMGITAVVAGYFIGNILINFAGGGDIAQVNTEPKEEDFIINELEDLSEPQVVNLPQDDMFDEFPTGSQKLYVVQLGAFNNRANAERLRDELLDKGYPSVIITEGPPFKVQLRASQTIEEAEELKEQIKKDGYIDVFIVH